MLSFFSFLSFFLSFFFDHVIFFLNFVILELIQGIRLWYENMRVYNPYLRYLEFLFNELWSIDHWCYHEICSFFPIVHNYIDVFLEADSWCKPWNYKTKEPESQQQQPPTNTGTLAFFSMLLCPYKCSKFFAENILHW